MKSLLPLFLVVPFLASCASRPQLDPSASQPWTLPTVEGTQNITQPQMGKWTDNRPLTRKTFGEVTIALGSGWDGFDSFRVFADGAGYAVVRKSDVSAIKIPFRISSDQLSGLIQALNAIKPGRLQGLYSAGVADGRQGFIEVQSKSGSRIFTWLDNDFRAAAGLYVFAKRELVPMVADLVARDWGGAGADAMEEYERVFGDVRF